MQTSFEPIGEFEALFTNPVDEAKLVSYLIDHSNLPGPRANLELLGRVADLSVDRIDLVPTYERWLGLATSPNDPNEYLPTVASVALGAIASSSDAGTARKIEKLLRFASNDARWRVREGVAMGLQRIGEDDFEALTATLRTWSIDGTFLEKRAILAALAHPPILKVPPAADAALQIAEPIAFSVTTVAPDRRKRDDFRTLKQGLSYALSVLVAASPERGFALLARLLETEDRDVLSIVRENLKKNRLTKPFPREVADLQRSLDLRKNRD